MNEMYMNEKDK